MNWTVTDIVLMAVVVFVVVGFFVFVITKKQSSKERNPKA